MKIQGNLNSDENTEQSRTKNPGNQPLADELDRAISALTAASNRLLYMRIKIQREMTALPPRLEATELPRELAELASESEEFRHRVRIIAAALSEQTGDYFQPEPCPADWVRS